MKRILFIAICLLLAAVVLAEPITLNFDQINTTSGLETYLRNPIFPGAARINGILTLQNGLTIDNATNNALELNENSDELIATFGSNEVILSSGDVLQIDFGSLFVGMTEISAPSGDPPANTGWLYVADNSGTTTLYFEDSAGQATSCIAGAGSPGGSDTQVQYNNGGAFGGIANVIWDDTNLEFADDQGCAFGSNTDYLINFDDSVDDQLLITTNLTSAIATTDPMIQILIDADTANGTGITADQDLFGVAKGTQASNTDLFVVDEDGDVTVAGDLTVSGTVVTDITLSSGETITNTTDSEIIFTENTGSENFIIDLDSGSNQVGLKSGTGVVAIAFGDVDTLGGIEAIVLDQAASSITLESNGAADDMTIALTGATDSSILVTSTGTGADAISISTSAGGMDLTVAGAAAAEDLDIASNTAVNISSSEAADLAINIATSNAAGQIQITSTDTTVDGLEIDSAGGIDIDAADDIDITLTAGAADEDILITTAGSQDSHITVTADGSSANALTLNASAGGVDLDSATSMDIDSAGAFSLNQAGDTLLIQLDSDGAADNLSIIVDGDDDAHIIIDCDGTSADAIRLNAAAGGYDIDGAADEDFDVDVGQILLTATHDTASAITLATNVGTSESIDLTCTQGQGASAATEHDAAIQLQAAAGGIGLLSGLNNANAIRLEANAGGSETVILHSNQGTGASAATESDASVQLLSDVGGIGLLSGLNNSDAIRLEANGGTNEVITIHANQGNTAGSITLLSDAGGITLNGSSGVVFTQGQTRKVLFTPTDVELDSGNPPGTTSVGTAGQSEFDTLGFDADGGVNGDDICYISWIVPDGYVADSAKLNVYWSFSTGEDAADEATMDFTVNAVAEGETLDAAGTAGDAQATVISDASADNGKLHVEQIDIEIEDIAVDDMVTIAFWFDESASALAASGTADVHFFEIEYESTE